MTGNNEIVCMDTTDAARYLGISIITLRNSRVSGLLGGQPTPPYRKLGRKVIYFKSDLEEWIGNLPKFQNTSQQKFEENRMS